MCNLIFAGWFVSKRAHRRQYKCYIICAWHTIDLMLFYSKFPFTLTNIIVVTAEVWTFTTYWRLVVFRSFLLSRDEITSDCKCRDMLTLRQGSSSTRFILTSLLKCRDMLTIPKTNTRVKLKSKCDLFKTFVNIHSNEYSHEIWDKRSLQKLILGKKLREYYVKY